MTEFTKVEVRPSDRIRCFICTRALTRTCIRVVGTSYYICKKCIEAMVEAL